MAHQIPASLSANEQRQTQSDSCQSNLYASHSLDDVFFQTRYSCYGYQMDVRETFSHLPFQFFWTWLSGKEFVVHPKRNPKETLLSPVQLCAQIAFSWSVIILCQIAGYVSYHSALPVLIKFAIFCLIWLLVVNRTRGLLHTFHYTNHGASIKSKPLAQFLARWFMSIPILHLSWDNYFKIHAVQHHGFQKLCSDQDPDELFMLDHGFYKHMPEGKFWVLLFCAPFHPRAIWKHIQFRLNENFMSCSLDERFLRAGFWGLVAVVIFAFDIGVEFALFYLFPLLILTQFSSWIQHVTEHMWFAEKQEGDDEFIHYGSLTWGRFLGRPYPRMGGILHKAKWYLLALVIDVPIKLFSFMQDLPSHDYHHRSPLVNFWSIARERRASENKRSKFGPMTETWGMTESFLIVRDSICYAKHDPFGINQPYREPHYEQSDSQ